MKIGIIGLGSIGQRHIQSLKTLGFKDIIALRSCKGFHKELPKDLQYIQEVTDSKEFYLSDLDGIIISNPTSLHIKSMKMALKNNIPVFVEKPLSHSIEEAKKVSDQDTSKVLVGYCLRHNSTIRTIKDFISSGKLGNIYKANLYAGQYLPDWHNYADYRDEYYSRKDLGGGALRTLSHELDLAHFLFGEIKELCGYVGKLSDLEINVDDNVYLICKMKNNSLVSIELDYLNPISTRKGTILGSNGILEFHFPDTITFTDYKNKKKNIISKTNGKDMYIEQMSKFVKMIKSKEKSTGNYNDGIYVLKIIHALETSMKKRNWQHLK